MPEKSKKVEHFQRRISTKKLFLTCVVPPFTIAFIIALFMHGVL